MLTYMQSSRQEEVAKGFAPTKLEFRRIPRLVLVSALLPALVAASASCGNGAEQTKATPTASLAPPTLPAADDLLNEAVAAQKAGDIRKAQELYQEVIKKDPRNKFVFFNLAVIEQTEGRPAAAQTFYEHSLRIDPNYVPALFNLAILREAGGQNEQAEELYRSIIAIDPENASAHLNLGFLLSRKLGNPSEGDAELRKAVELDRRLASRVPPEILSTSPPPPAQS
jgi:tetratricopeptide (TPR) repeat protein